MKVKEILLEQLSACYNKKNWFVSLTEAVEGLSAEQAAQGKAGSNNSIQQIVTHLIFWNERLLNQFKGIPEEELKSDNNFTFTTESLDNKVIPWEKLVQRLNTVLSGWQKEISKSSEEKLYNSVPGGSDSWALTIANIILHNTYHLGQLVCLRKEHGNWDTKLGV